MERLIDTGDIWQFPGFHFQAAAVYARRLREWAVRFLEPGHLRPSDAGGELIPSPFVGQAGKLERPSEVSMPNQEVALRLALAQAQKYSEHAERSLKLLIRAQAAGKERGFTAWVTSSQIRVAEAYLCDPGSSHQEAARDLFERLRDKTLPSSASWPPFKRFFLERSLLCGCAQLGLPPPALCSSTRAAPGSLDDLEPTPTDKLRSSFAKDAFEYLMMKTVPARNDPRQGEELLELVRKAADPLPAGSVEIQLHSGVLSQGLLDFTLTFDTSLLPVDLELGTCIAQTDDDDNISVDLEMTTWRAEQPLELKGLPANVNSVRFTWSSSPAIIFVGASNRRQTAGFNFRLPGAEEVGFPESFSRSLPRGRLGAQWSEMKAVKSDLFFPVDPAKALVSECFILYVTLSPPNGHSVSSPLFLSARFHIVDEDAELAPSTPPAPFSPLESSCLPSVSLISEPWEMMPLGSKILVADVANALIPKAGILAFKPGELKTPGANEAFAWPIAVQCGRPCKMALRIVFELDGAQISCPSCYINFQHAIKLQIAEERIATALALRRPVSFSLKCLSTPVETKSVEVCLGDSEMAKCLGTPGFMASGSQHSFLWTPGPSEKPRLQVQFQRGKGTEEFFLWCEEGRRKSLPQALPNAIVEWPLESIPQSPTSPQVELEVCSTGTVGASVLVRVQVKNMSFSTEEEIRVRILQGEGEVSDRYLLSGPVSYQVAAPLGSDPNQAIQSFALIPLKAGWLSLPRVQVSWAGQDATSSPTSLFVSPAAKPALWRTAA
ncbi:Acyltransferase-like protein [Durusdinium trenchii]|uniref:Chloroplastic n=1 Tax=Durusdinium trenchii TaxID=1381693 RepID=A0ABP0Q2E9_9DINO